MLAFSETLAKNAQTTAITENVTANDLWAFFQAKTIRMTVLTRRPSSCRSPPTAPPTRPPRSGLPSGSTNGRR